VLLELSRLGTRLPVDGDLRRAGNLRVAVVTLKEALSRTPADPSFHVELRIAGEPLDIHAREGGVRVQCGAAHVPQAVPSVPYEPMIACGDGRFSQELFAQ